MTKNRLKNEGALDRTNREIINHNFSDVSLCDTQLDATSGGTGTTLTNISSMVTDNLVPGGTYKFRISLSMVSTANCGSKVAFKFGAASMISSIEYKAKQHTASGEAVTRGTTATDQALLADNASSAVILTEIEGVVTLANTAALQDAYKNGTMTLQLQAAQHTSHADTMSIYVKSLMQFEHITTG